ncbi:MAG: hypothetical protein COW00_00505 [Bdellovibrio sp. CG12_big_fil_rev_8_21_14_0_65_39_13]|nr:MAG: hypothetical protein COW00_00505 [Bdellovibrio sp. CG12_big_fil_rev_8_21_14_0_65_39_13]PIR35951.1 MAG: hypothetical protein COV37_05915 [Bdellovibrio sp. CG11_big_fil_rev_8_21_14_0_20_39_38]PJB53950.1 MAG: hypothetical protein CO099_04325 [Bdellovibrio sp. CG_4_9_14_3_um_filter_39_7]
MRRLLFLLFITLSVTAQASDTLESFQKRFQVVKKDGKSIMIRDRSLKFQFSIAPYLSMVKSWIKEEQLRQNAKGDYEHEIAQLLEADQMEKGVYSNEQLPIVVESLKTLQGIDVDQVFSNPQFNAFFQKFELDLNTALSKLDPFVVANMEESKFFYTKRVTYQIVTIALNIAKKQFSQIALLNTASYVLVEVERMVREKRLFHQNMLLHYLENIPEDQIGLTHSEANRAFSSIYESRIPWYAFWESRAAQDTWEKYGTTKFFTQVRAANARLRQYQTTYDQVGDRLNFAFQKATIEGEEVVLNIMDTENMFKTSPAVAMYINNPSRIARKRTVLQLAQLGMSFLSLPSWIKSPVESYLKSSYQNQRLTEGALYGYFESQSDLDSMQSVLMNYQNPFDQLN